MYNITEEERRKIFLDIFRSICILHGTNNSTWGVKDCYKMAEKKYEEFCEKFNISR